MACCRAHGADIAPNSIAPVGTTMPTRSAPGSAARTTWTPAFRGTAPLFQWMLPLVSLVLIPKCPACVAAYVVLFTGVSLSFSTASTLRWFLIGTCIAALACFLVRALRRHKPRAWRLSS